jgi:hypothetical protein
MPVLLPAAVTLQQATDSLVAELLERAGIYAPPVDAFAVADSLGIDILYDAQQAGRARIKRLAGAAAIFLQPDERPERQQWAVAHEIGESLASRLLERAFDPAGDRSELREQGANDFASRLLLPSDWFLADAEQLDADVLALKSIYRTVSHELILQGLLRLPKLALVTVFDHGRVTRRRGNGQLRPPPLLPLEQAVFREVHVSGRPCDESCEGLRVQGWPVHEPGWKRELLYSTPTEPAAE